MKKSSKKKSIKIGAVVGAVVVLLLLIAFCVRPVSVGYSYSREYTSLGKDVTKTYHFNSFNKVTITTKTENSKTSTEWWYVQKNDSFILLGTTKDVTKEKFKEMKETTLEHWDDEKDSALKINAFKYTLGDEEYKCGGAVATVVVLAVVEVVLLGLAVTSFMPSKKKRK